MGTSPRILAFSGSARRESLNRKLLTAVVEATREAGGAVTVLDLNELPLPLYHGDLEEQSGLPANAAKLIELIGQHRGLLIASPEYNSMITPLLKNTVDWCTRGDDNPFIEKVVAVVSASPGIFGGVRSAQQARQLFLHLGSHVIPAQCTLSKADQAFDPSGRLTDTRTQKAVRAVAIQLVRTAGLLGGPAAP